MAEQAKDFKHIVRIAQVDLAGAKPVKVALSKIKGIGFNFAAAACNLADVKQNKRVGDLTDQEIKRLNEILMSPEKNNLPAWLFNHRKSKETGENKHLLSSELDFTNDNIIKMLRKIKSYRGDRHARGLPVRGQKTKSNFRKSKGKVVGVAKRKEAKSGRS